MKKFREVSKLTTEFLNGTLILMDFQYENDIEVIVTITYEDEHNDKNDYRLRIIGMTSVNFLSHHGRDAYSNITLRREVLFEDALMSYLAKEK